MSSIYAVVDKTKKKKNHSLSKKEMESDEADSGLPLYAVVSKAIKEKEVTPDIKKCPNDNNSNSDMHNKNEVTSPTSNSVEDTSGNPLEAKGKCISRKWIVTVLFIFVIILLFTCVICICIAFLELSRLKSDVGMSTSSMKQLKENFRSIINQDFNDLSQKLKQNITFFSDLEMNTSIISMELSQEFSAYNETLFKFQNDFCT